MKAAFLKERTYMLGYYSGTQVSPIPLESCFVFLDREPVTKPARLTGRRLVSRIDGPARKAFDVAYVAGGTSFTQHVKRCDISSYSARMGLFKAGIPPQRCMVTAKPETWVLNL